MLGGDACASAGPAYGNGGGEMSAAIVSVDDVDLASFEETAEDADGVEIEATALGDVDDWDIEWSSTCGEGGGDGAADLD